MSSNDQEQNRTFLQYDAQGFIISLKQAGKDVSKIDKTTEEIRDILLNMQNDLEKRLLEKYPDNKQPKLQLSALEQALIDAQIKPVEFADLIREQANPIIQATVSLDRIATSIEDLINEAQSNKDIQNSKDNSSPREAIDLDSPESIIQEFSEDPSDTQHEQEQQDQPSEILNQSDVTGSNERDSSETVQPESTRSNRDSRGRFTGDGSGNENKTVLGKIIRTIGAAFKGVMPSSPQGVDPTVDAINEVATVLSPVKRAAGFMLRPLTGWMKSRKRNEPLPKEQADHNRKQLKLLQKLIDNLKSKGGVLGSIGKLLSAGGGLLGGLFGGLIKNGGKILKFGKGLPVIGAVLTAMSFSNWGNKTTNEKGSAVGGTAGGLIGGAIGSLFGPLGTVAGAGLGSIIGEKIGSAAAPYIKEWTDSLIAADIPSMIEKLFSIAFKLTPGGIAKSLSDWGREKWNSTFNGQPNPSYLMRRQYGGQGTNGGEPVQFGAAANYGILGKYQQLADEIAKGEGSYTSVNTGGNPKRRVRGDFQSRVEHNLTNMTIDEILDANNKQFGDPNRINAAGKYQIIASTLKNVKREMGLTGKEKFTPELQDRMFMHLLPKSAKNFVEGKGGNKESAIADISSVWSSVANPSTGQTSHQDGINKASANSINRIGDALDSAKNTSKVQGGALTKQNISNSKSAESIIQKAKENVPVLNMQTTVTPVAARTSSLGASFKPTKTETKIQPAREFLSSPGPQEVVIKNQNSGTINQNVSNRILAHAITGGLGMGEKWDG